MYTKKLCLFFEKMVHNGQDVKKRQSNFGSKDLTESAILYLLVEA